MRLLVILILTPFTVFSQGKFFGGNGDGYDMATLNAVVLPVKVELFRVRMEDTRRVIDLVVAPGSTVCRVTLERSRNSGSFELIDSLTNPVPSNRLAFDFYDASPLSNTVYYRCKLEDCNGQTFYTTIVRIQADSEQPKIFFSYSDRTIHYRIKEDAELLIVDALGRVITRKKLSPGQGTLVLPPTLSGTYFLKTGSIATTIVL